MRGLCHISVALAAALGLGGCGITLGSGATPPQTVTVARDVVIGGPDGYCIDRKGSRLNGDSPFVLLGSCASIAEDAGAAAPPFPGVLTATVSPPVEADGVADTLALMETFVASDGGRAALARDGQAGSVTVMGTERRRDALWIHLQDTSENTVPGIDPTYWRGLFGVNGRLVTVSVMSFADLPLGSEASRAQLDAFIARIRRESASG